MGNNTVQVEYSAALKYWISNIQARIFVNVTNFSFLFVVPALYGAIFKFRKMHTISLQGIFSISLSVLYFTADSMENYFGMAACILLIFDRIIATFYISLFIWTFAWPFNATNDNANKQVTIFLFRDKWAWETEKETEQLPFNKNQLLGVDNWGSHLVAIIYLYLSRVFHSVDEVHICISWRTQEVSLVPKILKFYNRNIYV